MAKCINVEVELRRGETTERLVRRFIKKTKKSGILDECRDRRYYQKPSDKKRHKKAQVRRSIRRKVEEEKANEAKRGR